MKYIFGPVYSRRLGHSLGIDLLPPKICSLDCIYCEVGHTTDLTTIRSEYAPTKDILDEIDLFIKNNTDKKIDVFTITAMGEPTLHVGLGKIINHIKEKTGKPVAILTNGTLFNRPDVRSDLANADIVIPSLDSARDESFNKVNQPADSITVSSIVKGLTSFCKDFAGKVWLEILLVKGINDTKQDLLALAEAVTMINPDRIQLNTVARPPMDLKAQAVDATKMQEAKDIFTNVFRGPIDILVDFKKIQLKENHKKQIDKDSLLNEITSMLQRRPCTLEEINKALNIQDLNYTKDCVNNLVATGIIEKTLHNDREFYQQQDN